MVWPIRAWSRRRSWPACWPASRVLYRGSTAGVDLTVSGLPVFSAGRVAPDQLGVEDRELAYRGRGAGQYCKVVLTRGRLSGALAIGSGFDSRRLQRGVLETARIRAWQRWRFLLTGSLWK